MSAAYLKGPDALRSISYRVPYWCVGKKKFDSAVLANEIAGRPGKERPAHMYRCPTCGSFHIGSRPHRTRKLLARQEISQ